MLGYYKWTQSKDEREKIDTKIKLQYENKLSDWMGIEAIVRQKDRETTAANIARLSGNTPGKTFKKVAAHLPRLGRLKSQNMKPTFLS